ncbi:chitin deacetylase [Irineochytrium annulatum]|nr:chitin deacetylase [Irineochytrium annulatum]
MAYAPCAANNSFPACSPTFFEALLSVQRIPDPPTVNLWTKAMHYMSTQIPGLNLAGLDLPVVPPGNGTDRTLGSGAKWDHTNSLGDWQVTNPFIEMATCKPGKWAITYDDGPKNETLDFLKLLNTTAYQAGHQIGLHTWTHPFTSTKSTESIVSETIYTAIAVYNVIGEVPRYWRPPLADIDDRVRTIMSAFGLRIAMWSADSFDYNIDDGHTANWGAENSTHVVDAIFANGWALYNDTNKGGLVNVAWLPPDLTQYADGDPRKAYQGFISLEHELDLIEEDVAASYLNKIYNHPYPKATWGGGQTFSPAYAYECDQALPDAKPYLRPDEPFHKLVTYWAGRLPLSEADLTATEGMFQFNAGDGTGATGTRTGGPSPTTTAGGSGITSAPSATQSASVTVSKVTSGGPRMKAGGVAMALFGLAAFFVGAFYQ